MTTIYGISNCDTVKKALKFLDGNALSYQFHDFRKDGIDPALVEQFLQKVDLNDLVNKRSTTYRNLSDEVKNNLSVDNVIPLLVEQPTLIKRPVLVLSNDTHVGFKEANYKEYFGL